MNKKSIQQWKQKIFKMVSVGIIDNPLNQGYDIISIGALLINLTAAILLTFEGARQSYGPLLNLVEMVTIFFFAVDYVLRLFSADYLYPDEKGLKAQGKYIVSFAGVIDLLSFLPFYLPFFFPAGTAAFRMFRVIRILRLFRINAYYDSLNVITEVLQRKKQQLMSSVFIILILMVASSLCMYSLENKAQPDVFSNAFSGIWWAASTLLTVGYGDIYPVTTMGKIMGILITFLGVGVVAIPTGIISAGFVEQYSRLKKIGDLGIEEDVHFIRIQLRRRDEWVGKEIRNLRLPGGMMITAIQRGKNIITPKGSVVLEVKDQIILGSNEVEKAMPVSLRELTLRRNHPWNGQLLSEVNISRHTHIVLVKRGGKSFIPDGSTTLSEGDHLILYHVGEDKELDTNLGNVNI